MTAGFPEYDEQIRMAHGELIRRVVTACHNQDERAGLESILAQSEANGWSELVGVLRKILDGAREESLLQGLDLEDSVIARSVLLGLRDPTTLPPAQGEADPTLAGPGLAAMIHAAGQGQVEALQLVANMADQMHRMPGDMGRLGGIMRRLVNGERDPEVLTKGMGAQGRALVLQILEHLANQRPH